MTSLEVDDSVRALLETELDSFEKLEISRALWASGQSMSPRELEAACRLCSDRVEDTLPTLERARFVERDVANRRFRLGVASNDPRFAALMQRYDEDSATVLAALSSTVLQRLRSMAARAFADAFSVRKRRDGDG